MRKSLILCFILFPFLFSCLNLLGLEEKEEKGSIKVILEDSNDIDSFTITLLNESEDLIAQRVSNPGTNVLFEDLEVGNYIVNILAYDINNNLIKTGSKTVQVKVDEVTNAELELVSIPVEVEDGSIEVTISNSISSAEYIVSILDQADEVVSSSRSSVDSIFLFEEISPGDYVVEIEGFDADNNLIQTGNKSITVVTGIKSEIGLELENITVEVKTGAIEVNLEENSNVSSFVVTLLSSTNEIIKTNSVYSATKVLFSELEPGDYIINIDGIDSANDKIITGSKQITVIADQVVNATVPMTSLTGSVEIIITLPE